MPVFTENNKAAEKWTEEAAKAAFSDMLEYCRKDDDVFSLQQAYIDFGMHPATYYYLTNKFPVLEEYKKGMADIIIARINKGSIKGDYNPTASIWRSKQLGEKDTQYQNVDANVNSTIVVKPPKFD